jgi:hypothetical protein
MRWSAVLLTVSLAAFALADIQRIDKHTKLERDRYFVVFFSRPVLKGGLTAGHAFVAWAHEDHDHNFSIEEPFGYYPKKGTGLFWWVPAEIKDDFLSGSVGKATQVLTVQVDKATFEKSHDILQKWSDPKNKYKLTVKDCVTFKLRAHDVAKTLRKDVVKAGK